MRPHELILLLAATTLNAGAQVTSLHGIVADGSGAPIPGVRLQLSPDRGGALFAETGIAGDYQFLGLRPGRHKLAARRVGFAVFQLDVELTQGEARQLTITLEPATLTQELLVSGSFVAGTPEVVSRTPGSVDVIGRGTLEAARVNGFEEALRKATGVYARPEEGFSLRPNIGIRGLNPTRSQKVLLLEDGVPLAYAPYGDNASYYHPPVDRFDSIEVVKGSGQIAYGPQTVGGVVNYVTPAPPDKPSGMISLTGGNRDYLNAHARWGGAWNGTSLLLDGVRKQGEGARDNVRSGLNDFNAKVLTTLGARQALSMKANVYGEDSRVTYSGLRLAEWLEAPRQNPFRNDSFEGRRIGASATHSATLTPALLLTTNVYGALFDRDWWRQSSNSSQRPNDSADPACGGMANLHTTCGNEGRLRSYSTWGVEPRLRWSTTIFGRRSEVDAGVRAHFEVQDRLQMNGNAPRARTGVVVEDNERKNQAYSGFLQTRIELGRFQVTPGVRLEQVRYQRTNRLANAGAGVTGETSLFQAIPGVGLTWNPNQSITFFTGIHRGFAPPRTEDIISNAGGFVELDPELSWNYEAGVRARVWRGTTLESTYFRMDYSNQIIPASLAGGVGAVLTSAGETLHQGMELTGRHEMRNVLGAGNSLWLRAGWTWIPTARFEGVRYSNVAGFGNTLVTGNRLPYASESLMNASVGFVHRRGVNLMAEMVQTSKQYGDDLNTINSTPDGQRGAIPGNVIWNATLNVPLEGLRTTAFLTVKNLTDRLVLVDRTRGMLPGAPRLLQAGFRWDF
jgi:Fe(3+) dicitrate transport protein